MPCQGRISSAVPPWFTISRALSEVLPYSRQLTYAPTSQYTRRYAFDHALNSPFNSLHFNPVLSTPGLSVQRIYCFYLCLNGLNYSVFNFIYRVERKVKRFFIHTKAIAPRLLQFSVPVISSGAVQNLRQRTCISVLDCGSGSSYAKGNINFDPIIALAFIF